jgi:hypothetical protein
MNKCVLNHKPNQHSNKQTALKCKGHNVNFGTIIKHIYDVKDSCNELCGYEYLSRHF